MYLSAASRPSRARKLAVVTVAAVLATIALTAVRSDAASAASKPTVVLGNDTSMPDPLCPTNCQVIPSITGIQTMLPSGSAPYRMPFNGYVTKWKISLSKPTRAQRTSLNDSFGKPPQAGIAVLRKLRRHGKGRAKYLLKKSSPIEGLNRYLGTVASFKLKKPMKVNRGALIGLTVPTWAPALASSTAMSRLGNIWIASRNPKKCGTNAITSARPQTKAGSKRYYACKFFQSRLLYTVKVTKSVGPRVDYCGTRPGNGAYNYLKVTGINCSRGNSVYHAALKKFCGLRHNCSYAGKRRKKVYEGRVHYGNWKCDVSRSKARGNFRCTNRKNTGRVIYEAYSKS